MALSNEFWIDEYDYNEDLIYEEEGIDDTTSVADVAHTNVEDVVVKIFGNGVKNT